MWPQAWTGPEVGTGRLSRSGDHRMLPCCKESIPFLEMLCLPGCAWDRKTLRQMEECFLLVYKAGRVRLGTTVQIQNLLQKGEKFEGDVNTGLTDAGENFIMSEKFSS